jgi:hypothetical protein
MYILLTVKDEATVIFRQPVDAVPHVTDLAQSL